MRVFKTVPIVAQCSCSRDGVEAMLRSFSQDDRDHMVENGEISVTCEFCSANYRFAPDDVRPTGRRSGEAKPNHERARGRMAAAMVVAAALPRFRGCRFGAELPGAAGRRASAWCWSPPKTMDATAATMRLYERASAASRGARSATPSRP